MPDVHAAVRVALTHRAKDPGPPKARGALRARVRGQGQLQEPVPRQAVHPQDPGPSQGQHYVVFTLVAIRLLKLGNMFCTNYAVILYDVPDILLN